MAMRQEAAGVSIHENLRAYAVKIAEATRDRAEIACGASPRSLLALLRCAQAVAFMDDRNYCVPEDIAQAAAMTLPHRLVLSTGAKLSRVTGEEIVSKILGQVTVP